MVTSEIFDKTYQYLNGEISLTELEDWVEARFGLFAALPQGAARHLYGTIELGLAEISIGHRSEDEFRALVREFIRSLDFIFLSASESEPDVTGSTCAPQLSEWVSIVPVEQWTRVDIEPEKVP